jgi:hypothetical protein
MTSYLEVNKGATCWHLILNQHNTNKGKKYGGPANARGITAASTFRSTQVSDGGRGFSVEIKLDNSFYPDDGKHIRVVGHGRSKKDADEDGCKQIIILLLLENPDEFRLLAKDWVKPTGEIRAEAHFLTQLSGHVITPFVNHPGPGPDHRDKNSRNAITAVHQGPIDDVAVAIALMQIIEAQPDKHMADPSKLRGGKRKWGPLLNGLLPVGGLRPWVEAHPQAFKVIPGHGKRWSFSVASGGGEVLVDTGNSSASGEGSESDEFYEFQSAPSESGATHGGDDDLPPWPLGTSDMLAAATNGPVDDGHPNNSSLGGLAHGSTNG